MIINKNYKKYNFAFTLAEILITLGIIGVVASLTIPALIQNYTDQATVVKLKETMSILQQAMTSAISNEGPVDTWYSGADDNAAALAVVSQNLSKYLKVTKNCGTNTGCLPVSTYKDGVFNNLNLDSSNYLKMILGNGTILAIWAWPQTFSVAPYTIIQVEFYVDVNGSSGPNTAGLDLFRFWFYPKATIDYEKAHGGTLLPTGDVVYPDGGNKTGNLNNSCSIINPSSFGPSNTYCTSWAVYSENLDYKYVDDLNWQTKTRK